jgi:hypothetical protein
MIIDVKLNKKTFNKIQNAPDKIIYNVASEVWNQEADESKSNIPMDTGQMRKASHSFGVRGGNGVYKIGSPTSYAKYVWVMNNETTHWTTKETESKWYINFIKKHGKRIITESVKEYME